MLPSIFGESLFDDFMDFDLDKEFFGRKNDVFGKHSKNIMKTDVKELNDSYMIDIDLPGFKKDEVTAKLENGYLTISAAKGYEKSDKNKEGKYIRKERCSGQCARSFYVGENIRQEDIKGKFENGILKLEIPKASQKIEHSNFIQIE